MNLLHIATTDAGGAGKAAYRLHKNFQAAGHKSILVVKTKTIADPSIVEYPETLLHRQWKRFRYRLFRLSRLGSGNINWAYYVSTISEAHNRISVPKLLGLVPFKPDVVVLNWVSSFLNCENIYDLGRLTGAPVFWQALGLELITGGFHYESEFGGWGVNAEDYSVDSRADRLLYANFKKKTYFLSRTNLTAVTATALSEQQAKKSVFFKNKRVAKVYLGVDGQLFCPGNKAAARQQLGLPPGGKIIFFGPRDLAEKRKGTQQLVDALVKLFGLLPEAIKNRVHLLIAGKVSEELLQRFPFPKTCIGLVEDDYTLATAYRAADVFVSPSLEDVGPMMINESIICGTPVVSFDIGVAVDLVLPGKTGFQAKLGDTDGLARSIVKVLALGYNESNEMSQNCRNLGEKLCSYEVQLGNLVQLFNSKK